MSKSLRSLAKTLQAAGSGAPAEGDGAYLFFVRDGKLMQQIHTAAGEGKISRIALNVRADTPALYLSLSRPDEDDNEQLVFYFDKNNTLRCAKYDDEEEEWVGNDFGNITAHPKSQLGGFTEDDSAVLIFQDQDANLRSIRVTGGSSVLSPTPVQGNAAAGTSFSVIPADDKTHLFYLGNDMNVHHQVTEDDDLGGKWEADIVLPNSKFDAVISRAIVIQQDAGGFEFFALAGNLVISVDTEGKRITHGRIQAGTFVPETKEENTYHFHGNITISGGIFMMGPSRSSRPRGQSSRRRK